MCFIWFSAEAKVIFFSAGGKKVFKCDLVEGEIELQCNLSLSQSYRELELGWLSE